jgi:hypothetical protein
MALGGGSGPETRRRTNDFDSPPFLDQLAAVLLIF